MGAPEKESHETDGLMAILEIGAVVGLAVPVLQFWRDRYLEKERARNRPAEEREQDIAEIRRLVATGGAADLADKLSALQAKARARKPPA